MEIERYFVYRTKKKTVKFTDENCLNLFVAIQLHRGIFNYTIQIVEEIKFALPGNHSTDHIKEVEGKQNI